MCFMPIASDPTVHATSVTLDDVLAARERVRGAVFETPLLELPLGEPGSVFAKAENLQRTGSFKLRGAYNTLASLPPDARARGVVTHSSGNHAQGLACAASLLGVAATIVIPEGAPQVKVDRTAAWGARIVRCGPSSEERERVAQAEADAHGLTMVPPFDHPGVIAGQGTAALEIAEQLPNVANLLVPVGGGGLLSGLALTIKSVLPHVRVIGVEPSLAADAAESFRTGERVRWDAALTNRTIADGVRTQQLGVHNLPLILEHVDAFVTVEESAIYEAIRFMALEAKLVAEPTGCIALAAWHALNAGDVAERRDGSRIGLQDGPTVVLTSGGNIEPAVLVRALAG